ncbi:MAG: hypothetical protein HYS13_07930 [Planctomycetia bacterium]|nr:hypothetical protein [Planctomycetia bacterium]
MVEPDDEDRFVVTAREAALACKQALDSIEWSKQWNDFLVRVHAWCQDHSSAVKAGYVTVGDSALNVLVCVKATDYNFDLEDELAEFDLELSQQFPLCRADVMQIPNQSELKSGLPGEAALVVYGDGK